MWSAFSMARELTNQQLTSRRDSLVYKRKVLPPKLFREKFCFLSNTCVYRCSLTKCRSWEQKSSLYRQCVLRYLILYKTFLLGEKTTDLIFSKRVWLRCTDLKVSSRNTINSLQKYDVEHKFMVYMILWLCHSGGFIVNRICDLIQQSHIFTVVSFE